MRQERVLQVLLVLTGLFFVAGIYRLLTSLPQHQQSDYGDQMMLAVYFVLGVFLLLAVRRPANHRSLIAFTGWGTLAHDAVMAVQASQQKQLRSELLPLILVALLCIALILLVPSRQPGCPPPA
jgi:peptidoglycan/LPS O-acetylase OafA/YrhL